jgi:hypothetical protein
LEHLNIGERKQIEKIYSQDIFHLPDEVLSSTTEFKHGIWLEPSTEPVNARSCHLPESQNQDVRRQVEELKIGRIITESNSP